MHSIIYCIKNPKKIIIRFITKFSRIIPDKLYVKIIFWLKMGKVLDLNNPKTFNEKLQRLKLNDHNPSYTIMVDKYLVKDYVAKLIGKKYIIPTIGVRDRFDDIDFDMLPNQFVLKCTHDSGSVVICKNKKNLDKVYAKNKLEKALRNKFYNYGKEWAYKNVNPRIIAEKYMSNKDGGDELMDYKFMCFNGKVRCTFTCTERFSGSGLKVTFFDKDWKVMPFERHYPKSLKKIDKPKNYEKMVQIAEILSKDIPFVRVDLYEINEKIYFGELTFYPGDGFEKFYPEKWDYVLGEWIHLP